MSYRQLALVTGVAGGIGKALAEAFAGAGYHVIGMDCVSRPSKLVSSEYIQVDLNELTTSPSVMAETFANLVSLIGDDGLAVLINNAATQRLGGVESIDVMHWHETLNVNLLAPFLLTQRLLPKLEAVGGCVINIGSIHARLTKPGFVAYATSKAALSGMTRAMAVDLGGRIRVNAIEPGAISTEMLKAGFNEKPEQYARLESCHPQGRIGSPEEVAALALSVAGGDLRFLHGACISLDGGISGRLHDPA